MVRVRILAKRGMRPVKACGRRVQKVRQLHPLIRYLRAFLGYHHDMTARWEVDVVIESSGLVGERIGPLVRDEVAFQQNTLLCDRTPPT